MIDYIYNYLMSIGFRLRVPSILGTRIGVRVVRCLIRVVWGFDGFDYVGFVEDLLGLQGL
jgi:hypothetical protein